MTDKQIEDEITKWRKWLFDRLDIDKTYKELTEPFDSGIIPNWDEKEPTSGEVEV